MKKLFALAVIFALVLSACKWFTDDDNDDTTPKLPNLTIRNESSFILTNVTFSDISFSASGSSDLPVSGQSVKQLKANDLNTTGYITFTRKDIGIICRTPITITNEDRTFIFLDTTIVEEQTNSSNTNTLAQISFLSKVTIQRSGLTLAKNDTVNLGEAAINYSSQNEFTLRNTGVGKLLLTGNEPVKISGEGSDVFSVIQPASSEVAPNGSLTFKINFNPKAIQAYTAAVTINSNDPNGIFNFTVTARGAPPKPIASVFYENTEIPQNGTIDAGIVVITHSKNIAVEIKNTGTEVLTLDTENITISGANAAVFGKLTNPGANISVGSQTSFIIECKPTEQGENNAILVIPTNDDSRNPIVVYLRMTAEKGSAVLELTQADTVITNNSLTPFDFGRVELGSNKPLAFTIKNTGNIDLELTGDPVIESSNALFAVPIQPVTKTISPGDDMSFILRYTPAVEAEENAAITIYNSGNNMVFTLNVKGTGYVKRPQITVKRGNSTINQYGEFNFGTVALGENKDIAFDIENTGEADLNIISVNGSRINLEDNTDTLFSIMQQPSAVVIPGNSTNFIVRFSPTIEENNFAATVHIKTDSQNDDEFYFMVKGSGYEKRAQITVKQGTTVINTSGEYHFGSLLVGNTNDVTFTVENSGEADLSFITVNNNRINLEDNTDGYFAVIQQPFASTIVSPGSTTTFIIRYIPTVAGNNFTASVHIKTNSQYDGDFSFWIRGNSSNTYKIGDTGPGGGLIFFAEGGQYKECSAELGSYPWDQAVTAANNHRGGGYANWRLPDRGELSLMYQNLYRSGLGGFAASIYWSSVGDVINFYSVAWYLNFNSGTESYNSKSSSYRVRAVRTFSL